MFFTKLDSMIKSILEDPETSTMKTHDLNIHLAAGGTQIAKLLPQHKDFKTNLIHRSFQLARSQEHLGLKQLWIPETLINYLIHRVGHKTEKAPRKSRWIFTLAIWKPQGNSSQEIQLNLQLLHPDLVWIQQPETIMLQVQNNFRIRKQPNLTLLHSNRRNSMK